MEALVEEETTAEEKARRTDKEHPLTGARAEIELSKNTLRVLGWGVPF